MSGARTEFLAQQVIRLRTQAAQERSQLVVQAGAVAGRTAGVRATAHSALGLAERFLGSGAGGTLLSSLARAGLVPVAVRWSAAALRSRVGRLVLVGAAVGAGVWWWRQAKPPLPPQDPSA